VDPTVEERATTPRVRRLLEATAFVAVWVALGYLLPVDANAYLLLGVPLTAAFQLLVRRRPLRELWVRDGPPFRLDRRGVALAVLLAVVPVVIGVRALAGGAWVVAGWTACAVVGALPAAWTLSRAPLRQTLRAAAPATIVGGLLMAASAGAALVAAGHPPDVPAVLDTGLRSALLYLPAGFVLEEVAFRGALDAHVHHPGEPRGLPSAVLVGVLWGVWHLPLAPPTAPLWITVAQLVAVHGVLGVLLSYAWRRTGSLAAPGLAHALIDGVRNGLLAGVR
jgi:membrane protease YdiL (CAAX protease family)